jgi:phosphatidylserine/phosphatidylglycerophosphate/cardiolipin synthase-like enzyme
MSEFQTLLADSGSTKAAALVIKNMVIARRQAADPALLFDLVLSGPDVPGVPTCDTGAVMASMVEDASKSLLIVGYAVHQGAKIFKPLAERMEANPNLLVTICIDIPRKFGDSSLDSEIIRRYATEFRKRHWPWEKVPKFYHDPRSLSQSGGERSSLHAKVIVADQSVALISSANLTEAAQKRNIEAGVLTKHQPFAERISTFFQGLIAEGYLTEFTLPALPPSSHPT